ncbi:MAG: DUF1802 family protein [Leptolyngbya sp. RL_3_1]|nr:DUF1802 family protein [Leptolyngbya sp. RL_3_1]
MQSPRVALFSTVEHQKADWLKPAYRDQIAASAPAPAPARPESVTFAGWAEITEVMPLSEPALAAGLTPFHIWTEAWALERLAWKPQQPLLALCLRTYRFAEPQQVAYQPQFGGCRSWVPLPSALTTIGSVPVLSDRAYDQQVAAIQAVLSRVRTG